MKKDTSHPPVSLTIRTMKIVIIYVFLRSGVSVSLCVGLVDVSFRINGGLREKENQD